MTTPLNESTVEDAALQWFAQLGYQTVYGPNIAPGESESERDSFEQVYLYGRLRDAVRRINPGVGAELIDEAIKRLERAESQSEVDENARVHKLLAEGVPVEYRDADGSVRTKQIWLIDWNILDNNDWLAVNQYTIVEGGKNRRPDVVVFINGLPLGLLELKNPADEHATLKGAWNQVQTYRGDIPSVFTANVTTVISDGTSAAMSSFTGGFEHYAPWKTIEGREVVTNLPALEVLIKGVFDQSRMLDILRNFVVFSDETVTDKKSGQKVRQLIKRVAKYHQYWAVNAAVESTVQASSPDGDRRGGVVWHTQGSGKSFEMVFYAAKIMRDPQMSNPTLVFITDRNDLDDQLFGEVFAPASILPEKPQQADTRADLRDLLRRASGGIIFTTLQKFRPGEDGDRNPVLTDRRNVVVVADEAHRSQYGFSEKLDSDGQLKAGLAKHMRDALPGATYLGFTGTPIESNDKSTRAVFGDYIDIYDLTRAVEDGATVKIFYESRLAKVELSAADYAALDEIADEITSEVEESEAAKAKSRWSRLEAIVGAEERLDLVARDIVDHWEKRREALFGKGMIVAMSRRIAVRLYEKIVELRPDWHNPNPAEGKIKVVMTGSAADPPEYQPHIYSKDVRKDLKLRAKNPDDPLELVIVRDMWLTGFDAPSMHTMYVDKTMQGAGLMQAIARVNRTFRDKPGGLVVDYIGVFANLQAALAEYSPSDRDQAGVPIEELVDAMLEKHDIVRGLLHSCNFDSSPDLPAHERLAQHAKVLDFVMADPDRTERFNDQVLALAKAFALCGARDEAEAIRNDVRLFIDVRSAILKIQNPDSGRGGSGAVEIDTAIGQLVNEAVTANEVVDIYKLAGVETPELSILSDEFLDSLSAKEKPNLQMGLLRRLINDEIKTVQRTNIVQARKFSEQLEEAINKYTNRSLTTAEIIAELVKLAKEMRDDQKRHEALGLREDEIAFYDAIVQNDAAVLEMGDETLKKIAHELVTAVRSSATIDWNLKDSVKAAMRSKIRRLLAKYDYPPDHEEKAIELVLQQAELFAGNGDGAA
ncbi:HsdR family type I site-specific deoxyribonuclease [Mycobacteroides abscessus subsp. abscessus]|uniref:type I restriction endonuclease subunit R n=1 Tax=Mycobacteroides abscessus TaxID=36809 RepID=UPI0009277811|nr:type I restriction endonuclease subunit R [Mycobacteroides abscessus]SHV15042.1 HsdR family type I site-specific deoxyribonuclease [Mycobacteroides abscessus subsp. abscessus]SKD11173.1 HsdR family type I site-specific deoxyribonuclease [Mycobacteroides abscessus subsp. abscessus]SKL37883.1 HsdR family type I site-specific deoxyribonuclease [Mycobacteroides abscessus subsp. abscessus]SKM28277.1 HsdR family type I site-specific deoxyribonuclease [Mycobacteroides abscessus subsp. abscessus]